jgi:hypothetical protein
VAEDAGRRYVRFTRSAGERIGRAVIAVEKQSSPASALTFEHQTPSVLTNTKNFRVGTFSGSWGMDSTKVINLRSGGTLSVENFIATFPDDGTKKIGVAKDGTGWFLVCVQHVSQNVVWNVSQSSTALTFDRMTVWVPAKVTTSPIVIALAECVTGYTGT